MEKLNNTNQKIKRGSSQNQKGESHLSTNKSNDIESSISKLRKENRKLKSEILTQKNMSQNYLKKIENYNKTLIELKKQLQQIETSNNNYLNNQNFDDNYYDGEDSAIRAVEQQIISELCNNQEIDLIERLPGVPFRKNFVNESECGICRDEFKEGETIKVLKCNHLFHRECLGQWLINNKKCIICEQLIKL